MLINIFTIICLSFLLIACQGQRLTGSPTGAAVGAGAGAGSAALLGASNSVLAMTGLGGAGVGYYVTTLGFQSKSLRRKGGKVYQVGDMVAIYIPSDMLFESNTADFLPQSDDILNSVYTILQRKPNNNILISGNTSGFYRPKWEQKISQQRAEKISAYLWNAGLSTFQNQSTDLRKLNYVGYGDYFPIANKLTNKGIRENSRIQITSYPNSQKLCLTQRQVAMTNFGGTNDQKMKDLPKGSDCFESCC